MKLRSVLLAVAVCVAGGCTERETKQETAPRRQPQHVFYLVKTAETLDIEKVNAVLDEKKIGRSLIKRGWGSAWHRNVAGARLTVYASVEKIWIYAPIEDKARARDALHWLVQEAGTLVGASLQDEGSFHTVVKWPVEEKPGKRMPQGIVVPQGPPKSYLSFVSEGEFRTAHGVAENAGVRLVARGPDLYWTAGTEAAQKEMKAATLLRAKKPSKKE